MGIVLKYSCKIRLIDRFQIHTETGNIWTHLLGVMAFVGLAAFFMSRPVTEIQLEEKLVFMCFFAGAIACMGLSFLYHTLCCHKGNLMKSTVWKFHDFSIT